MTISHEASFEFESYHQVLGKFHTFQCLVMKIPEYFKVVDIVIA